MTKLLMPVKIIEDTIHEHCDMLHRNQANAIMDALHAAGFIVVNREDHMRLAAQSLPAMIKAFDL